MRMVHWVSSGIFSRHCIIIVITFSVSERRSVGLRPTSHQSGQVLRGLGTAFRRISIRRHDFRNMKQADLYVYICRMNDQQSTGEDSNSVSQCFSSQANDSRTMQALLCTELSRHLGPESKKKSTRLLIREQLVRDV